MRRKGGNNLLKSLTLVHTLKRKQELNYTFSLE